MLHFAVGSIFGAITSFLLFSFPRSFSFLAFTLSSCCAVVHPSAVSQFAIVELERCWRRTYHTVPGVSNLFLCFFSAGYSRSCPSFFRWHLRRPSLTLVSLAIGLSRTLSLCVCCFIPVVLLSFFCHADVHQWLRRCVFDASWAWSLTRPLLHGSNRGKRTKQLCESIL